MSGAPKSPPKPQPAAPKWPPWVRRAAARTAASAPFVGHLQQQLKALTLENADLRRQATQLERMFKAELKERGVNIFLPPPELRMHVGKVADASNFWAHGRQSAQRVIEVFGEDPGGPVLDWGCGTGRTLNWLKGRGSWKRFYRGCDVDAEAIAWLGAQGGRGRHRVAVCGDDPPLPYPDASFVGLFCFSVLTHIHPLKHRAWHEEIHRVLKPGGRAYVTVTSDACALISKSLKAPEKAIYEAQGWFHDERDGHYKDAVAVTRDFTLKALEGLFEVETYRPSGYQKMDDMILRKIGD